MTEAAGTARLARLRRAAARAAGREFYLASALLPWAEAR
jgi:hypothetical protein